MKSTQFYRTYLGIHPVRHPKNALPQKGLGTSESPRDLRQVPNRFDRRLTDDTLPGLQQNLTVRYQPSLGYGLPRFRQVDVSFGNGDGGPYVEALIEVSGVDLRGQMSEGVDGGNLLRIGPALIGTDVEDRAGQL